MKPWDKGLQRQSFIAQIPKLITVLEIVGKAYSFKNWQIPSEKFTTKVNLVSEILTIFD